MKKIIALCLALIMTACANIQQGTPFTAEDVNGFEKGVTTNEQVRAKIGEPNGITQGNNGEEIWTYYYSEAKSNGMEHVPFAGSLLTKTDTVSRNAQLIFTSKGILKNVSYAESKGGSERKM